MCGPVFRMRLSVLGQSCRGFSESGLWGQTIWVQILAQPLTRRGTPGKLPTLSVPQFLYGRIGMIVVSTSQTCVCMCVRENECVETGKASRRVPGIW